MKNEPTKRLSEAQLEERISESLQVLSGMCKIYDEGNRAMAFGMSTEMLKILTDGGVSTRVRGSLRFPTVAFETSDRNLMPEIKLVGLRVGGDPVQAEFFPVDIDAPRPPQFLKFRDWWRGDVIYRAGAAKPDAARGMIPLLADNQVPYELRRKLVRQELVETMRNKIGAHTDAELPEVLFELERENPFGIGAEIATPSGLLSTYDGSLSLRRGPLAALTRRIAAEVLAAYANWSPAHPTN
ncbi:MAG: hypothetical protein AB7H66_06550 [Hyphomonadaceae bacterium]